MATKWISPSFVINGGSSYLSRVTSYVKHPTKLLTNTVVGWLANTTLNNMEARSDPALSCLWTIALPPIKFMAFDEGNSDILDIDAWKRKAIGAASSLIYSALDSIGLESGQNINLGSEYVQTAELVFPSIESRETPGPGGYKRKYAGPGMTVGDLTLSFYGGVNNKSLAYIMNWMRLVAPPVNATGAAYYGFTPAKYYKQTITIGLADENDNNLFLIDYLGCWPSSISNVSLTNGSADVVTFDATFSVDEVKVYGYSGYDLADVFNDTVNNVTGKVKSAITSLFSGDGGGSDSGGGSSNIVTY